jgi:hypothetical protein
LLLLRLRNLGSVNCIDGGRSGKRSAREEDFAAA